MDEMGSVVAEINEFTGAYIDETRGSLKLPDVPIDEYSLELDIFKPGEYHWFDLQFFYKNLQDNVDKRIDAYLSK